MRIVLNMLRGDKCKEPPFPKMQSTNLGREFHRSAHAAITRVQSKSITSVINHCENVLG